MEASSELSNLHKLQSTEQKRFLDVIDSLRAHGVGEFTSLPQLVVCGDQSSGKSSVLQSISGVPFPRKDTLCTRHATEVILRRSVKDSITVSIVCSRKGDSTSYEDEVEGFTRVLEDSTRLGEVFEEAEEVMGLHDGSHVFTRDVLRLEISGPDKPSLTLVDLPGFIQSTTKNQKEEDKGMIRELADEYLKNEKSIILAVVSAKYDIANQCVISHVKGVDKTGARTLGIITKPDTLNPNGNSKNEYLALARNEITVFGLGWHVVRNLDAEDPDSEEKDQSTVESKFFSESAFGSLPVGSRGIPKLRTRLSSILFQHIKDNLQKLVDNIKSSVDIRQTELTTLGRSKTTKLEHMEYLSSICSDYSRICRDAICGNYFGKFFASDAKTKNLCSIVMQEHNRFAHRLLSHDKQNLRTPGSEREKAIADVLVVLKANRGPDLPGLWNPQMVGILFTRYSESWGQIALDHIKTVWYILRSFVADVLHFLTDHRTASAIMHNWFDDKLDELLSKAKATLNDLTAVHKRSPLTLNPGFIDNYYQIMHERSAENPWDNENGSVQMTKKSRKENSAQAPAEHSPEKADILSAEAILDSMLAYYRIALCTFVDNIPTLAIDSPMLYRIPDLLPPGEIFRMDDELLALMVGDTSETIQRRAQLAREIESLEKGLDDCKHLAGSSHYPVALKASKSEYSRANSTTDDGIQSDVFYDAADKDVMPQSERIPLGLAPRIPATPPKTPSGKSVRRSAQQSTRVAGLHLLEV